MSCPSASVVTHDGNGREAAPMAAQCIDWGRTMVKVAEGFPSL